MYLRRRGRPTSTAHLHGASATRGGSDWEWRRKKKKKNNLQTWSGYLINYDNTVRINEQLLQRASRLWQLRIVAEGNSTSSGVCHRNEQDLCQYFVNKQIWNGSANISPLRWEGSFNEECCVPTIFNRPAFEWQCTAAEHMLCFGFFFLFFSVI